MNGIEIYAWCAPRPTSCTTLDCSCEYGDAAVTHVENDGGNNCTGALVATDCNSNGTLEVATVECQK
jgi:hypothetical protein